MENNCNKVGSCGRIYHIVVDTVGSIWKGSDETMFMGEFSHTIDVKGRLIIPAKLREELGEQCIVTRGLDPCLTIYTREGFNKLAENMSDISSSKMNNRVMKRFLFGSACELEFDRQGRVLIPAVLRQHAKLEKETVVVGANDRVEIWSRSQWDAYNDEYMPQVEKMAEEMDSTITF